MTAWEWAIRPLKLFAQFRGRAPRMEYWGFIILTTLISFVIDGAERALGWAENDMDIGPVSAVYSIAILIPSIAVGVRRLHDIDRTGWWWLAIFIPMILFGFFAFEAGDALSENGEFGVGMAISLVALLGVGILLFVFTVLPGTKGPNRFGPDPYGPGDLEEVFA